MNKRHRRGTVIGVLFMLLGLLFLLEAFDVFELAPAALWPILLISLGIGVLVGGGDGHEGDPPTG